MPNLTIEQVVAVISAAATLIAYILGEGMVDAARAKFQNNSADSGTTVSVEAQSLPATKTREEIEQLQTNRTQQ